MQTARLDMFISHKLGIGKRAVRLLLAQRRVLVDNLIATDIGQKINKFSVIKFDQQTLPHAHAIYLMLHKPIGVVSATKDDKHRTVLDLIDLPEKESLHIVGRLDLNTSGLILLTNDSRWSERLTLPTNKVAKTYQVTVKEPLTSAYITAFEQGMYFSFENITTKAAKLELLGEFAAQVTLMEGRYHQIKRMFGRFQNQVLHLHRSAIGNIKLDPKLLVGESRLLTTNEINNA